MKEEWRVVAIFNVILFIILVSPAVANRMQTLIALLLLIFSVLLLASRSCTSSAVVHGETLEEATQKLVEDRRKYFKTTCNS
jgi:hypothetical protein